MREAEKSPLNEHLFLLIAERVALLSAWKATLTAATRDILTKDDPVSPEACFRVIKNEAALLTYDLLFGIEKIVLDRKTSARSTRTKEHNTYNKFSASVQRLTIETILEQPDSFNDIRPELDKEVK